MNRPRPLYDAWAEAGRRLLVKAVEEFAYAERVSVLPAAGDHPAGTPCRTAGELGHSLLGTVFTGHFRFLGPPAAGRLGVPEGEFWALVRAEIDRYHARFPELAGRCGAFGLLAPSFERATPHRERFGGGARHGTVANPLTGMA
ncbi:ferric iron reductase [Streptomyces sp. NPDC127033]|uniref:ferric iron reductase n=1 Tax=Streptomyces sp. NPDC127033 TaxID=3347110 RepID=UPI003652F966